MAIQNAVRESWRELVPIQPLHWIQGQWRPSFDEATYEVFNPSTGEMIGEVAKGAEAEARMAVEVAHRAFLEWRQRSTRERADYLWRIHELLLEHRDSLGELTALEQGAPLATTKGHVDYAASFFRWYAEEARRIYGRTIAHPDPSRRLRVEYFPVGVAGMITAWNVPLGLPAKKIAAALAAGCTVVLKPAELTPLSALALAWISSQAQLPPGVLNVISGDAPAIGRVLLEDPRVRVISFTGSVRTGKYLMSEAGKQLKRVALELGGNAPFIVFADADLKRAAQDLVWLKCMISGQICVTANRVLVEKPILESFVAEVTERLREQKMGDPANPQTTVGPLIRREDVMRVAALVEEAVAQGARVHYQGAFPAQPTGGYFYPLTLLTHVTPKMNLVQQEIFGPLIPILAFERDEEALTIANDTPYGLAAYVYTRDMNRAQRFAEALEVGVVGINDPRPITAEAPFGGVKQSGIGREGGCEGLKEYLDERLIGFRF